LLRSRGSVAGGGVEGRLCRSRGLLLRVRAQQGHNDNADDGTEEVVARRSEKKKKKSLLRGASIVISNEPTKKEEEGDPLQATNEGRRRLT